MAVKDHFKFNLLTHETLLKNRRKTEIVEIESNYCGIRSFLICGELCIYFLKSSGKHLLMSDLFKDRFTVFGR